MSAISFSKFYFIFSRCPISTTACNPIAKRAARGSHLGQTGYVSICVYTWDDHLGFHVAEESGQTHIFMDMKGDQGEFTRFFEFYLLVCETSHCHSLLKQKKSDCSCTHCFAPHRTESKSFERNANFAADCCKIRGFIN